MIEEAEDEKSFCYVEGTPIDKNASHELSELHENVWYRMKPPKPSTIMYSPFVSARQIDLIRNVLLGRTSLKSETNVESIKEIERIKPTPRRDVIEKPCLKKQKSSVRFLNERVFDP